MFVAQLTRVLDYNRGLVTALESENARLRAELAIANAAREVLRNADGTVRANPRNPPECRCCKRGLHHGSASAMMDECPTCGHPGFAHKSIVAECRCCAAGLDHGRYPAAAWRCLRCDHPVPAHVNTRTEGFGPGCRCCARGVAQGDGWANHDAPCPRCLHTYPEHFSADEGDE